MHLHSLKRFFEILLGTTLSLFLMGSFLLQSGFIAPKTAETIANTVFLNQEALCPDQEPMICLETRYPAGEDITKLLDTLRTRSTNIELHHTHNGTYSVITHAGYTGALLGYIVTKDGTILLYSRKNQF